MALWGACIDVVQCTADITHTRRQELLSAQPVGLVPFRTAQENTGCKHRGTAYKQ